ncbi:uncharacterized protein VTP21DRAFT_5627, partial [Calcarisporiella thermophila]|uniref:uncharacterized protein n=1 Tax=Calcarisporiella thermophila TaxID=911321 RepID=UPI00374337FE
NSENRNANTKANGPGNNSNYAKQGGEGIYKKKHWHRGLEKRGLLDNSANGLDLIDHLSLINSMVNSNPQNSENRNANTKANGPGNNSNFAKQRGEGIYKKKKHWRRGLLDNTLNNPDIIDHISAIDSTVNSNPQDSENRNANTKASGPGDNSNISKQGGEGLYFKHHSPHHHWRRNTENRNANTETNGPATTNTLGFLGNGGIAGLFAQRPPARATSRPPLVRRGLLDNTLNGADILDHISLLDSMVNSNPQEQENRNANTKASGPGNNSNLAKQRGEGIYYKHY